MKIRVIDIFIKIANNEEVPKKIKFNYKTYIYKPEWKDYASEENMGFFVDVISSSYQITKMLNEELEIIEEDKEIEEVLDINLLGQCDNWLQKRDVNIKSDFELNPYILEAITDNFKLLYHKQCELIKAVNSIKKGN